MIQSQRREGVLPWSILACLEQALPWMSESNYHFLVCCVQTVDYNKQKMLIIVPTVRRGASYACRGRSSPWRPWKEESAALGSTLQEKLSFVWPTERLACSCEPGPACERRCMSPDLKTNTLVLKDDISKEQKGWMFLSFKRLIFAYCKTKQRDLDFVSVTERRTFPRETGGAGLQEVMGGGEGVRTGNHFCAFPLL